MATTSVPAKSTARSRWSPPATTNGLPLPRGTGGYGVGRDVDGVEVGAPPRRVFPPSPTRSASFARDSPRRGSTEGVEEEQVLVVLEPTG
jgi:hypothetical protein